jgi:hypothetical protein
MLLTQVQAAGKTSWMSLRSNVSVGKKNLGISLVAIEGK